MFETVAAMPWQAWLAAAQFLTLIFWKPLTGFVGLTRGDRTREQGRIEKLEDLIDELRRALDKGRVRESAIAAVAELLIFAIDHVEEPSSAMLELRARALEVLELAHAHLQGLNPKRGNQ
jgi:hypothetical protein